MSKTADLRKLVNEQLKTVQGGTYHRNASRAASYPYKVFTLQSVSFTEVRDDYELCVDVWDRGTDAKLAELVADHVEALFAHANLPQATILPTFFRESRHSLDDPDKTLQHIQLRFSVQLYEMEE